ncbi:hypothetical protein ACJZ2D_011552 [Fusarium nematophilum]
MRQKRIMPINSQQQSAFVARLPREVRDAIYLELWRSCGLRHHIVSHWERDPKLSRATGAHFCRWPCSTPYQVEDDLQEEVDLLRIQENVALGNSIMNVTYQMRLESPWLNHWKCGEHVEETHGMEDDGMDSTSGYHCWKNPVSTTHDTARKPRRRLAPLWDKATGMTKLSNLWRSVRRRHDGAVEGIWTGGPYLSMLLSCKTLSEECLKSIYESTTFIFTDVLAWQMFIGFCEPHPDMQGWPQAASPPPAFRKYATSLELSLSPVFSYDLTCTSPQLSAHPDRLHNPYDFHWMQLNRFENLRSIKIWVAARTTRYFGSSLSPNYTKFNDLSLGSLDQALSCFNLVDTFVLSTPLAQDVGIEDGYVERLTQQPNHLVWRRGAGDLFHPGLDRVYRHGIREGYVEISTMRHVRIYPYPRTVSISCGPLF